MAHDMAVLVVDDSTTTRELLRQMLRRTGVREITTVTNGEEALSTLAEGGYDLVISDLHMPEMDGMALYRNIKAKDPGGRVQFVLATADGTLADLPDDYRVGGHRMLRKPYTMSQIALCLDEVAEKMAPVRGARQNPGGDNIAAG